jgi:predicted DNA-binding protein
MVTRSIDFTDEVYSRMKDLSKNEGVSVSAIIKVACAEYVTREAQISSTAKIS